MNYTLKLYNRWNNPFYLSKDESKRVVSDFSQSFSTDDASMCEPILKELLDVPLAELTLDEVKKSFSDADFKLAEDHAVAIQNYYNGRFALYHTALKDLSDAIEAGKPTTLHYDIPEKYNSFGFDEKNEEKQLCSYIEIGLNDAKEEQA